MHSSVESAEKIPAFLYKLWKLVEDKSTDHLIRWGEDGRSFILCSQAEFSHKLLPLYYKHNNMASFVRQLNMYGFRKVPSMDGGGLRPEKDEMEFAHPYFIRGQENGLELIKRKMSSRMPGTGTGGGAIEDPRFSEVLSEVKALRQKQDSVITQMTSLKRENQIVYAKYRDLQTKFTKQQNIISKLMRFIVTMMKPGQMSRSGRKLPHLTNNALYAAANLVPALTHGAVSPLSEGPVIHEVVDDVVPATVRTRPQTVYRAKPAQIAPSSSNVVLQATPAVHNMSPDTESLLDPGLHHEPVSLASPFALSPHGVILHPDGQPVTSNSIVSEPSLESYISPQPLVESPKGTILSSELPQRNIKIEYLQDEPQAVSMPLSNVVLSPAPRVTVGNSVKPTVTSDVKPKIMSYVRSSKEGFGGAGKNTVTYTLGPNNTYVRADSSSTSTTASSPIVWNNLNSRSSNSAGATDSSVFREESSSPSMPSDKTQNVITSVTVIPSDSNSRFSNPARIPGKVLTTNSSSALRLKNTQSKDGKTLPVGQTSSGNYIIRRTIGSKNPPTNTSMGTSSSSGSVIPANSAVKRRFGESVGPSTTVAPRRISTDTLQSNEPAKEQVPVFKVVQMNTSQQDESKGSSAEDVLAQVVESALSSPAPAKEVTDVVPAHGSLGRDASGVDVVGQLPPTGSHDLILANDSTSVAIPPNSSSGATADLSPHDQVMKNLDEMEEAVENLQEMMKNNNIPCEPTLMSKIFNPDYPYSELDFFNDLDMSSYDTMGLSNDSGQNQQQLSLYNPAPMDLAALVDSPTGDDLSEEEPFAMASFDPEFITTPKVDTAGNIRKRFRDENSGGCNDDLHPLLKDLC